MDVNKDIIDLDNDPNFLNTCLKQLEQLTLSEKNPQPIIHVHSDPSDILKDEFKNNSLTESGIKSCSCETDEDLQNFNITETKKINNDACIKIEDDSSLKSCDKPFPDYEKNISYNFIKKEVEKKDVDFLRCESKSNNCAESGKISCFEEADKDFQNINSSEVKNFSNDKCIKIENDISFRNCDEPFVVDEKNVSLFIKKEIEEEEEDSNFLRTEQYTDSSSSEEDEIIERSGRIKKRSHKKKIPIILPPISPEELNLQRRLHCSSGRIIQTVENSPSPFLFHNNFVLSYNEAPQWELPLYSPESGYDTSVSNDVHSPSPPNIDPADLEKAASINKIYNEIKNIAEGRVSNVSQDSNNINHLSVIKKVINRLESAEELKKNLEREKILPISHFNLESQNNTIGYSSDDLQLGWAVDKVNHSPVVTDFRRTLCYSVVESDAKNALRNSEHFNVQRYENEKKKLLLEIKQKETHNNELKIIDIDERERYSKLRQTQP